MQKSLNAEFAKFPPTGPSFAEDAEKIPALNTSLLPQSG